MGPNTATGSPRGASRTEPDTTTGLDDLSTGLPTQQTGARKPQPARPSRRAAPRPTQPTPAVQPPVPEAAKPYSHHHKKQPPTLRVNWAKYSYTQAGAHPPHGWPPRRARRGRRPPVRRPPVAALHRSYVPSSCLARGTVPIGPLSARWPVAPTDRLADASAWAPIGPTTTLVAGGQGVNPSSLVWVRLPIASC